MERLIDAWDAPTNWTGRASPIGDARFYPNFTIKTHSSLALQGECVFTPPAQEDCMDFLSFTFQGEIRLEINGVFYETERHAGFFRAHFPAPARVTEIKIETDHAVVSDLRTWKEEFPRDIVSNLIEEMEPLLPPAPCGELAAEAGERRAVLLSDFDFIDNNVVIRFNGETHQIRNINGSEIEFCSAFDGEKIISDFSGGFSIVLLVEMGYYDREAVFPSVTLWYDSPKPNRKDFELASRRFKIGSDLYTEKSGSGCTWDVAFEIVSRSPELLQAMSSAVRAYLAKGAVWINGLKTEFAFTEAAASDEPSEEFDILPRVSYRVSIDVSEGNEWRIETAGTAKVNAAPIV
jgi:hypothetical protein